MKPENIEKIYRSFELQAPNFESKSVNFTKEEYLNYTISCVAPCRENTLLEVAAGTCACGRSFAPLVRTVVCLDATVPVLRIGQQEAADEVLRKTEDEIETQRDPSHVKNLSKAEMLSLFETHGLAIEKCETTEMPQRLENWLALTRTPEPIQRKIKERMRSELAGGEKTGFSPYVENGTICFNQKWLLLIGRKR